MKSKIFFLLLCVVPFAFIGTAQTASITGTATKIEGSPIINVNVVLNGTDFSSTATTSSTGSYTFSDVPTNATYTIELNKADHPLNGVSTLDMVFMLQDIVKSRSEESVFSTIAADINEDGRISVLDVWQIRQLLLGLETYPDLANWRFTPADFEYTANNESIPHTIEIVLNGDVMDVDFVGVKLGDVTGNADAE